MSATAMRMSSLLHSVPPSLPFPHISSTSTSPPPHGGLAATSTGKPPNTTMRILASTTSKREPKRQEDDYHSTLKALNSKGRFPRKSLGQHYMLNASVNEELVAAANVKEGDIVLEIGPGTGSLTNVLVDAGATVLAIEKVVEEDFTRSHIRSHMSSILPNKNPPDGTSRSAKDEAALRLVDSSLKTSEYRPINIFVNFYSDPEYLLKVSRTNFFPQPKVDAAVVAFKLKQTVDYPRVSSIKSFFSMVPSHYISMDINLFARYINSGYVNSAFNGKRKMLRKSLQHICPSPEIEAALCAAGLPPTARPEELTLEDFVKLHNLIVKTQLI
ncbi:UNVERIFIED_CONTAM: Ribosomal RNA small subunit methyltransferase, chloroplastic [Sesamum calycinum]|uniref:rRNA adenine N(6)-methyltransferase n=1 Tax=Sesamum calycinum TaxID=2727403 RepID=A0AAW2SZX3_9LAMI